jgi:uncharacterized membrane protein
VRLLRQRSRVNRQEQRLAAARARARESSSRPLPTGWAYNPSSWAQRGPIIILGFIGMCIASYLAAFQFGFVGTVWDPVFGSQSTIKVLESKVSKLFPVPDAFLGALGYLGDWVFGAVGGSERYKKMPWVVMIFGIFIVPFGGTSIALALIMPTLVGAWCFLCLINTIIAIILIPMSWDEVWLSYRAMRSMVDNGASWWDAVMGRAADKSAI